MIKLMGKNLFITYVVGPLKNRLIEHPQHMIKLMVKNLFITYVVGPLKNRPVSTLNT